jgi:hypothetical protein
MRLFCGVSEVASYGCRVSTNSKSPTDGINDYMVYGVTGFPWLRYSFFRVLCKNLNGTLNCSHFQWVRSDDTSPFTRSIPQSKDYIWSDCCCWLNIIIVWHVTYFTIYEKCCSERVIEQLKLNLCFLFYGTCYYRLSIIIIDIYRKSRISSRKALKISSSLYPTNFRLAKHFIPVFPNAFSQFHVREIDITLNTTNESWQCYGLHSRYALPSTSFVRWWNIYGNAVIKRVTEQLNCDFFGGVSWYVLHFPPTEMTGVRCVVEEDDNLIIRIVMTSSIIMK